MVDDWRGRQAREQLVRITHALDAPKVTAVPAVNRISARGGSLTWADKPGGVIFVEIA